MHDVLHHRCAFRAVDALLRKAKTEKRHTHLYIYTSTHAFNSHNHKQALTVFFTSSRECYKRRQNSPSRAYTEGYELLSHRAWVNTLLR